MRGLRWRRLFAVVAAVALVASACGDDDEAADEETTETTEAAEDEFDGVTLTATEYEFDAPDEIHASTVDVRAVNEGNVAHEFGFVKIGDQEPEAFFEEFDAFIEADFSGPLPDAILEGTVGPGIGELQPGDDPITAEMSMSQGTWLLFCALSDNDTESGDEGGGGGGEEDGEAPAGRAQDEEEGGGEEAQLPPHYQSGMFKVIDVTGDPEPSPPSGDATVTIVDYGFEGTEAIETGDQTVVGYNSPDSQQLHHIVALDFGEVTAADAEAQFKGFLSAEGGGEEEGGGGGGETPPGRAQEEEGEGGGGGPPGGEPEEVGGTFPVAPGYGTTFDLKLTSGHTYVFACFISDKEGGPPHALAYDMFKAFTLA